MASMLLGEYLRNASLGDFQTRTGRRDVGDYSQSHAWLEQDGLLVDITADQFDEIDEPVIVTTDSPWHRKWNACTGVRVASLGHYDADDYRDHIRDLYDQLNAAAQVFSDTAR